LERIAFAASNYSVNLGSVARDSRTQAEGLHVQLPIQEQFTNPASLHFLGLAWKKTFFSPREIPFSKTIGRIRMRKSASVPGWNMTAAPNV
jgi:hypothetical protein